MTALSDITPAGWVCIVVGAWVILACVGSAGVCAVAARLKRKPKPQPEVVNWIPYLPPVPPTQAEIDATWLDVWPTDLTDELVDRLFDDIVAIEGLGR